MPLGVASYAGKRKEVFAEWKTGITELAKCSNVNIKLGGLTMPACGFGWNERDVPPGSAELATEMGPYYRHCVENFGASRCMFESNFPPDKASCSYTVLYNAFKRICNEAGYSQVDKDLLFHDTAARVYRLNTTTGKAML